MNQMATVDSKTLLGWLKAAGEHSRLRLLALCARQEMSVSDLADALRQSEPRVSRHLRILSEAGLVERARQGQWVHYRLTDDAAAAAFVRGVLGQVDRNDGLFSLARRAGGGAGPASEPVRAGVRGALGAAGVGGVPTAGAGSDAATEQLIAGVSAESRLGRALKGFVEAVDIGVNADRVAARTTALIVGVEHLELLETAAAVADECVAIAHSRRAAQSARAFVERRGLVCRVLLAASANALCDKDIESAGAPFDTVFIDHLAVPDSELGGLLTYGRRALAAGGRLWVFERYDSLQDSREKVVEHPIGRLRRLLHDVGLSCERLSPIEADGEHVIAAIAVPSRAALALTGAPR